MMASASNRLREMLAARGIECMRSENGLKTIWYSSDGTTEYMASERHGTMFTLNIIHKGSYTLKQLLDASNSRYERMFGTPERAARTLADLQTCSLGFDIECDECAVYSLCQSGARHHRDALLEWLRGDAE